MNPYEPTTPRAALGLIAAVMSATTMVALVVLPAKLESVAADRYPSTAATGDAVVTPACVEAPKLANPVQLGRRNEL